MELRRTAPKLDRGDAVLVYASSPVRALVGAFFVQEIQTARPSEFWWQVKSVAGISGRDYTAYFDGASKAVGIFLTRPYLFPSPIELAQLRRVWPQFHPPQSYRYLSTDEVAVLGKILETTPDTEFQSYRKAA